MSNSVESRLRKSLKNVEEMKTPSCIETETIGLYIEGKLPGGEKTRVEKHISCCLYCLNQLVELRELAYFQKNTVALTPHLLQKILDLCPNKERSIRRSFRDILASSVQKMSDFFTYPVRQWRYATVSIATALVVIFVFLLYRGPGPEKSLEIGKIITEKPFTVLSLKEVRNPIILETGDIDDSFEKARRLIQAHNGKMIEAVWIEKGVRLTFNLAREEEASLFAKLSRLGKSKIEEEGYRNKKGNIVILLKLKGK